MNSIAYRKFKKEMGQANHFLITIMIGLDAVEDGAQKKSEFKTSWNPQDVTASVIRSKIYAIKSALAWTVDNLDMYLRLCNRKPRLLNSNESDEFSKTKHSVYKKYKTIVTNHPELETNKKAFVDLLVCWRNNLVHFDAENQMLEESKKYFDKGVKNDEQLKQYNFDEIDMLKRFNEGGCPTFKETTTLISMTIHFVKQLDALLLSEIKQELYLDEILCHKMKNKDEIRKIFGYGSESIEQKIKSIRQYLVTFGITDEFINKDGKKYIEDIAKLHIAEIKERLKDHTLIKAST
ncbi:hypothetical protein SDC9_144047 [bioreactor metagenome]|uniref:Uncharacterized protein n=1 Tax=bioreactor metagenome TaxID=1076179 RepID=A0A645E8C3_9ZZZZ